MIIDKMLKEGHLQEQDVKGCQIFDFGSLEMSEDRTEEERSATLAFNEGFLNLPASECIFVGYMRTTGNLSPYDFGKKENLPLIFKLTQSDEQGDIEVTPFKSNERRWIAPFEMKKNLNSKGADLLTKDKIIIAMSNDNFAELTNLAAEFGSDSHEVIKHTYGIFHTFITVSLGRLISDGIEQEKRIPSEKLNKKRIARGYPEMVSHTVVKLKPCRLPMGRSGSQGEYFTPKRYHFRRGHVRHFENGQKTWVRSCFVGDISQGRVEHRYEVSV